MSAKADWIVVAGFSVGGARRVAGHLHQDASQPILVMLTPCRGILALLWVPTAQHSQQQAAVSDADLALHRSSTVDGRTVARISLDRLKALSGKHRTLLLATVSASAFPVASLVQ